MKPRKKVTLAAMGVAAVMNFGITKAEVMEPYRTNVVNNAISNAQTYCSGLSGWEALTCLIGETHYAAAYWHDIAEYAYEYYGDCVENSDPECTLDFPPEDVFLAIDLADTAAAISSALYAYPS